MSDPRSEGERPLDDDRLDGLRTEEDARSTGPSTAAGPAARERNTCNWGVTILCDNRTGPTCTTGWTFRCDTNTCTYGWTFKCDKGLHEF